MTDQFSFQSYLDMKRSLAYLKRVEDLNFETLRKGFLLGPIEVPDAAVEQLVAQAELMTMPVEPGGPVGMEAVRASAVDMSEQRLAMEADGLGELTSDESLLVAVLDADLSEVRRLLEAGADPDSANERNESALTLSVFPDDPEIARLLLECGADPEARDREGGDCPSWAEMIGAPKVLEALREHAQSPGADGATGAAGTTGAVDTTGAAETPVAVGTTVDFEVTSVDLSHDRSVLSFDTTGIPDSPMRVEVEVRCHGCRETFVHGEFCDFADESWFHTRRQCPHCTSDLSFAWNVSQEAGRLTCRLTVEGETHLRHQVPGEVGVELVAIMGGVEEPLADRVLKLAGAAGEPPSLDLLEAMEDVNVANEDGSTLLALLCYNHTRQEIDAIIAKGAAVNHRSENGGFPLIAAVGSNNIENVRALMEAGADPDRHANNSGFTALHQAVFHTCVIGKGPEWEQNAREIAFFLLDSGADPDTRDQDGDSPLSLAESSRADDDGELKRRLSGSRDRAAPAPESASRKNIKFAFLAVSVLIVIWFLPALMGSDPQPAPPANVALDCYWLRERGADLGVAWINGSDDAVATVAAEQEFVRVGEVLQSGIASGQIEPELRDAAQQLLDAANRFIATAAAARAGDVPKAVETLMEADGLFRSATESVGERCPG